jgi:hypothetical protein
MIANTNNMPTQMPALKIPAANWQLLKESNISMIVYNAAFFIVFYC